MKRLSSCLAAIIGIEILLGGGLFAGTVGTPLFGSKGTSLPSTCTEGLFHHDTDAGGAEVNVCTATDTWTKLASLLELTTHAALTTNVHGIADVTTLVTMLPASQTLTGLSGATATATDLIAGNCTLEGVRIKVTSAVTGATGINVGTAAQNTLWGENIAVALNTTTNIADFLVVAPTHYRTATSVVLTAVGSNFTGGNVQVVSYCRSLPGFP